MMTAPGGRSWTDRPVYDAGLLHDGSEIFADLTLDNRGNPYVGFVMNVRTEYDIWVEASFDGGTTWNGRSDGTGVPYLVNTDQGTHFFAAIAAGNPGQVDVAYLDTPTLVGSTPYGKPNEPTGDANADWNVFVGQSTDLLSGSPPRRYLHPGAVLRRRAGNQPEPPGLHRRSDRRSRTVPRGVHGRPELRGRRAGDGESDRRDEGGSRRSLTAL